MGWGTLAAVATGTVRDTMRETALSSYTPSSTGVPESIPVIYERAHEVFETDGEQAFSARLPMIDIVLSDLTVAPLQDDLVTVGAIDYRVTDVQYIESGLSARLLLVEVS